MRLCAHSHCATVLEWDDAVQVQPLRNCLKNACDPRQHNRVLVSICLRTRCVV